MLYGRRFPPRLKGAVYSSQCMEVKYGARKIDGNFTKVRKEKAMCGVQPKDRKQSMDLMFMLSMRKLYISWLWQTVLVDIVMC